MFRVLDRAYSSVRLLLPVLLMVVCCAWAPLSVAAASADTCSMGCCVEAGHCCCLPAHARVEGQVPSEGARFETAQVQSRCPAGCLSHGSSHLSFRDGSDSSGRGALLSASAHRDRSGPDRSIDSLLHSSSSPRAPPADDGLAS